MGIGRTLVAPAVSRGPGSRGLTPRSRENGGSVWESNPRPLLPKGGQEDAKPGQDQDVKSNGAAQAGQSPDAVKGVPGPQKSTPFAYKEQAGADLARIAEAWPHLPEEARRSVLAIMNAFSPDSRKGDAQ